MTKETKKVGFIYIMIFPSSSQFVPYYIGKHFGTLKSLIKYIENRRRNYPNYKDHFHKTLTKYKNWYWYILHKNILTEEKTFQLEISEIEYFETYDYGFNTTVGGDGISGFHHSKETRTKISKKHIGKKLSPKSIQKRTKTRRKNGTDKPSKKTLALMSKSNKIAQNRPEVKIKRSKAMKKVMIGNQNALGWIPDSKWRKTTAKRMKKINPMKNPKIKLKFIKRYLNNAKQRLIEAKNLPQYKINSIKRQIKHLQEKIKELKLLISQ